MKLLPIGIENFKEMIDKKVYYIDKSELAVGIDIIESLQIR